MTAADVQASFAATLVDEWARAGVTDAVVAPGSRSTPLLLALAADGRLRVHVVLDERSAGFFALGIGLATGRPAVVVTTSGTAAAELHPAVVEAHQAGVPLLAVTADRPPELHGVGAPQTIDQDGLFGSALRWSAAPGVADGEAAGTWRSLASRAVAESVRAPAGPGPVHLNLAFREPLLGTPTVVPAGRAAGGPWHSVLRRPVLPPDDVVARLRGLVGRRGLIVAGAGTAGPVGQLAESLGWPVFADPPSGARVPGRRTVAAADTLLRLPTVAAWRPEVVLRLGQPWASRVVSTWLASLDTAEQVLIDPHGRWSDPERRATTVVQADIAPLCQAVVTGEAVESDWATQWTGAEAAAQGAIDLVLGRHDALTEPAVARIVAAEVADGATLFVSSSMPVRDVEWYSRPRPGLAVRANRGANGIDGIVSTALGLAAAGPVVALVGDLAFLYDAGALLWARQRDVSCTLVVVDNNGGGIFSFLPQASGVAKDRFERLWGTPHGMDLASVARAYGLPVTAVARPCDLPPALAAASEGGGVRVIHVRTDREANVAVHREIEEAVRQAVVSL
jgi:2-succinyl-5-enolpyruvyl-6-hydroxy-3-cyclohexene-1-carboxylate synthase